MNLDEWQKRNDTMVVALNDNNKVVAAGWFNLKKDASKDEKKDLKDFYKEVAGLKIEILAGDTLSKFRLVEWVSADDGGVVYDKRRGLWSTGANPGLHATNQHRAD